MDFSKLTDENDEDSFDESIAENESTSMPVGEEMEYEDDGGDDDDEDENDDENDDDDDESENDSDDDDEENEAQLVADINRLQEELSHDPNDYMKHVDYLSKLRTIGELEILREAREKMNKIFPIGPALWLEWIEDEWSVASTDEQKIAIRSLYERAVAEYVSADVWTKYLAYMSGMQSTTNEAFGEAETRKLYERALTHFGCSVADGSAFWTSYLDFEMSVLESLDANNTEAILHQVKVILGIYQRQLTLPLANAQSSYTIFEAWLELINEKFSINLRETEKDALARLKTDYEKALKMLEKLMPYECEIAASEYPHYEAYMKYIDFEIVGGNLARTQCLFERAITDNCVQAELWLKYVRFCNDKFVVDTILLPIYERAVRNCHWEANLWIEYLRACEQVSPSSSSCSVESDAVPVQLREIFSRAMQISFASIDSYQHLWLCYLQSVRRKLTKQDAWKQEDAVTDLRDLFETALEFLQTNTDFDYCYPICVYYAKVEAKFCANITNFRQIFNDLLKYSSTHKRKAEFWLEFAALEQRYGEISEARKMLYRGLEMTTDYPESIATALLRFEEEESDTIDNYCVALRKIESAYRKRDARLAAEAAKEAGNTLEKNSKPSKSSLKRKATDIESEPMAGNISDAKKKKVSFKGQESAKVVTDTTSITTKPAHGVTVKTDEEKREQTVFLSNLNFDLGEDEVREAFAPFGTITEIRLVRDYKGRSKGYCYVEYEKIESVRKALLNDRMLLGGRPVFISEMDKRNKFTYSCSEEKNKLFIKNIPFEVTKEDLLAKVFSDYTESIVDARLITFRNGHSKGLAYVEMKNAEIAQKAVLEKNDFELGDRRLFVAISDPSLAKKTSSQEYASKNPKQFNPYIASSTGNHSFMLPRSLMPKSAPSKVKMQVDFSASTAGDDDKKATNSNDPSSNGSSGTEMKKLGNDQFRSMFIK